MFQRYSLYGLIGCGFFLVNIVVFPLSASEENDLLKSVFIINFTKFIEWPADKSIDKQSKIDVCVLGSSDISAFSRLLNRNQSSKPYISLVNEKNLYNVSSHCHMLIINSSESYRLNDALALLKEQPVLIIGDFIDSDMHGGMVEFILNEEKIKILVNRKEIEKSGLRVDAQLLEIAFKVEDR